MRRTTDWTFGLIVTALIVVPLVLVLLPWPTAAGWLLIAGLLVWAYIERD
jgi:hypothetical protein